MSIQINYKQIGSRLAAARKQKGLKQKDVACQLDVADNTISNMERGTQELNLQRLVEMCVLYGIKPGVVIDDCCNELIAAGMPPQMAQNPDKAALYVVINSCSAESLRILRALADTVNNLDKGKKETMV